MYPLCTILDGTIGKWKLVYLLLKKVKKKKEILYLWILNSIDIAHLNIFKFFTRVNGCL